ncbi:MAG: CvpA family protein [Desulfocucumaceae bacterium]
MNVIDWVIIALFLAGAVSGYRKGFVASLIEAVGSIAGIIAAYIYYAALAKWLDAQFALKETLGRFLGERITLPQVISQFKAEDLLKIDLNSAGNYLDTLNLDGQVKLQLLNYLEKFQDSLSSAMQLPLQVIIQQHLASILINILAFLIIWGAVSIILQIIGAVFRKMIQLTPLGIFDSLGGTLVSVLITALSLTVFLGILAPLLDFTALADVGPISTVLGEIGKSTLVPHFRAAFTFLFNKFIF